MTEQLLARALEIAASGECADVGGVKARLRQEGWGDLEAIAARPELMLELGRRCRQAQIKVRPRRGPLPSSAAEED